MRWLIFILLLLMSGGDVSAQGLFTAPTNSRAFTPLHTYFINPAGNDACNGTSASLGSSGNCAWLTPFHSVVCGDVIIAAAGTYTTQFSNHAGGTISNFGTVSSCPSASGGIDGAGGIYFAILLCGGSDLETCTVNCSCLASIDVGKQSNWAVEGFKGTAPPVGGGVSYAFVADSGANNGSCTGVYHHVAFINNVSYNSGVGFGVADCGLGGGTATPGIDYWASVGNIAQNSNQGLDGSTLCVAQIDPVGLAPFNTVAGTHAIMYGNFSYHGLIGPNCLANFDGEAYMWDSADTHGLIGNLITANNIGYYTTRSCIQLSGFDDNVASRITLNIYNNTCYNVNQLGVGVGGATTVGVFDTAGNNATDVIYTINLFNNIIPEYTNSRNGVFLYTAVVGGSHWSSWKEGTAAVANGQNISYGVSTNCGSATVPTTAPCAAIYFNTNPVPTLSQNTYGTDPVYADTTDLMANAIGVPDCTGFVSTTQCMGWNAATQKLTIPVGQSCPVGFSCVTIGAHGTATIYDLMPTAGGMSSKGFQIPSTTCISSGQIVSDYPTWLKGIVYLHWTGSAVMQNFDLVTLPCGL